jgi:hypothetical protein
VVKVTIGVGRRAVMAMWQPSAWALSMGLLVLAVVAQTGDAAAGGETVRCLATGSHSALANIKYPTQCFVQKSELLDSTYWILSPTSFVHYLRTSL